MLVSCLTEDAEGTREVRKSLAEVAERSLQSGDEVSVPIHLTQKSFGVVVCRPDSFSALPQDTQGLIRDTVYEFWRRQPWSPYDFPVQPG